MTLIDTGGSYWLDAVVAAMQSSQSTTSLGLTSLVFPGRDPIL